MGTPQIPSVDSDTKLFPTAVMNALKGAIGSAGTAAKSNRVAFFGDSMTAYAQGGYASFSRLVAEYLGLSIYNPSTPGERTSNISLRQGGYAPKFTVPGGVIPADTSSFAVTLAETYTVGFNSGNTANPNIGLFSNASFLGIPVVLTYRDSAWTMARVTADTAAVTVPTAGAWVRDIPSSGWRDALQVYMGGFNGGDQVQDVALMRAYLNDPTKFVLLGMANGTSGSDPTAYNTEIARVMAAYPAQSFNMAAYVRDNGLADEGMVPTAQDTADIAAGVIPVSLRRSSTDPHYNAAGHRVIARRLAELLIERGFITASTSHRIPPRVAVSTKTKLSLPATQSNASVPAISALQASDSVSVRLINLTVPSITDTPSYRNLASRWGASNSSWQFLIAGDGKLFAQDANGPVATATAIAPVNGKISLRLDINRTAGTLAFYTSSDSGATWTVVGTPTTGRSTTNPISGYSIPLSVGWNGSYGPIIGSTLDRITILNAAGGTLIDHDFTAPDTEGWSYSGGAAIVSA